MEKTNSLRTMQGVVTSVKMEKTIVVTVETHKTHPIYGKRIKVAKKFMAHDEKGVAKLGDVVEITECRPLSKNKHFRLTNIVKAAVVDVLVEGE